MYNSDVSEKYIVHGRYGDGIWFPEAASNACSVQAACSWCNDPSSPDGSKVDVGCDKLEIALFHTNTAPDKNIPVAQESIVRF
jgi:hypothetical protein